MLEKARSGTLFSLGPYMPEHEVWAYLATEISRLIPGKTVLVPGSSSRIVQGYICSRRDAWRNDMRDVYLGSLECEEAEAAFSRCVL